MSKVCLVNYFMWPVLSGTHVDNVNTGGEEVQHSLLAKALSRAGAEVSVVTGDFGQEDGSRHHGVRVHKSFKISAGLPGARMATGGVDTTVATTGGSLNSGKRNASRPRGPFSQTASASTLARI